jgi:hypothetical protein
MKIYLSVALFSFNGFKNVYMKEKLQSSCSDGKNKRKCKRLEGDEKKNFQNSHNVYLRYKINLYHGTHCMLYINYIMVFQMCVWVNIKDMRFIMILQRRISYGNDCFLFTCKIFILSTFKNTKGDI